MEDREEQIAKQIAEIQRLAATNKNIDATALIQQLLSSTKQPELPPKDRTPAYMGSLPLPPFCLFYVVKVFYDRRSRRQAGGLDLPHTYRNFSGSDRLAWGGNAFAERECRRASRCLPAGPK